MRGEIYIKRPICVASMMYIIGILMGLYLHLSIAFLCLFFLIILVFVLIWSKKKAILLFLIFMFIGSMYVKILDINYDNKYEDVPIEIMAKGIIISETINEDYKYSCVIKVLEINSIDKYSGTKLNLNINKNKMGDNVLKFGDEIELKGELVKPNEARNYKGFDYKSYLKSKGIYGTIKVENYKINKNNKINIINYIINNIKNDMKNNINQILNKEEAALCVGILIGDREEISKETEDNFKKSNLTHMLAVSGSHITYIINGLAILLSKHGKKFSKVFTIFFLIFFMALTGFTSSVIRACIMGILVLIASLIHRKSDTMNNLGISSFIILIVNPYAINDMGFLLSYGGTIGIVLLNERVTNLLYKFINKLTKEKNNLTEEKEERIYNISERKKILIKNNEENNYVKFKKIKQGILKYLISSFSITISANLIIIPLMAYNFSTFSFTFWLSNILAAPIMEIVTIFRIYSIFCFFAFFTICTIFRNTFEYFVRYIIKNSRFIFKNTRSKCIY